jgi:hypothetical protein
VITNSTFWFWFGGLWLAVGLCFLGVGAGVGVYRSELAARLDGEGVRAEGLVLTKEISAPRDRATSYNVTFRFDDGSGRTIRGSAKLDPEAWDALVERGPIEVVYLADRPQTYRIAGQSDSELVIALVFPIVGAVLAIVGGFILGNALRTRRVARTGAITEASVLDVRPGRLHINGIPQWELRYRFQDASGRAHEGKCSLSPDAAQRWKPGAVGRVRYDMRNPRANVWTGQSV